MNSVVIKDLVLGQGMPKICVPLTAPDQVSLLAQANLLSSQPADLAEWRADLFSSVFEEGCLEEVLPELRNSLPYIPLLFTFRTAKEGGSMKASPKEYADLAKRAITSGLIDLVDLELFLGGELLSPLIRLAHGHEVKVILSNHDFFATPRQEDLVSRLKAMEALGADIAKIAVMPQTPEDVLTLLSATCQARRLLSCPVVTMSMDGMGLLSRLSGEVFGSCMTFGSVGESSAPGQIPASALKEVLTLTHRTLLSPSAPSL